MNCPNIVQNAINRIARQHVLTCSPRQAVNEFAADSSYLSGEHRQRYH